RASPCRAGGHPARASSAAGSRWARFCSSRCSTTDRCGAGSRRTTHSTHGERRCMHSRPRSNRSNGACSSRRARPSSRARRAAWGTSVRARSSSSSRGSNSGGSVCELRSNGMDDDRALVERQLGRPPRAFRRVVVRCPFGRPAVTEQAPFDSRGEPFPTTYYLTCPHLVAAVSRLEAAGGVDRWSRAAAEDPELLASLERAHEEQRRLRPELEL